jgi:hypothetical protein
VSTSAERCECGLSFIDDVDGGPGVEDSTRTLARRGVCERCGHDTLTTNVAFRQNTETGRRIEAGTYRRDVALTLRGLKDQEKRDRMVNAWGAVHCHELERARKSWWVGCCLAALTLVCLPLALLFGFELDGPVRLFALGTLVGLVVVAYQLCLRAIGDALLSRHASASLGKLLEATKSSRGELAGALERQGFATLARHVASRWYAHLDSAASPKGPYR